MLNLLFALTAAAIAATPCDTLVDQLKKDPNAHFVKVLNAYTCGPQFTQKGGKTPKPVAGCFIRYESNWNQKPSAIFAYIDTANNLRVNWIISGGGNISGWEGSGHYLCADVKTYVRAVTDVNRLAVRATRATAYDQMFCPFGKTFTDYEVTCQ